MPGNAFLSDDKEEDDFAASILHGEVLAVQPHRVRFDSREFGFLIAQVKTALGVIPVPMHPDYFDLSELAPG